MIPTSRSLFRGGVLVLAAAFLAGLAGAQSFSGPGGMIPASGTGGGGVWPPILPPSPFVSSIDVPVPVSDVVAVELTDFTHTWIGDVHVVLEDPGGGRHTILYRPGSVSGSVGSSGPPLGSPHILVESGGLAVPTSGSFLGGTYNQHFGDWPSGTAGVSNTPLGIVTGPAGTWTLRIYDWASGDTGTLGGWTLTVNGGPTVYCTAKTTSSGCVPSIGFSGLPGPLFVVRCFQVEPGQLGVLFYSTSGPAAIAFQGGTLCVVPPVNRMPVQHSGGFATCSGTYFQPMGGVIGMLASGTTVHCQHWFRDPGDAFGTGLSDALGFVVP